MPTRRPPRSNAFSRAFAILLTGIVVIGVIAAVGMAETRNSVPHHLASRAALLHGGDFSTTASSLSSATSTACALLNSTYIPPAIQQNVTVMFAKVCALPQFVALVQTWGPSNFTLYYSATHCTTSPGAPPTNCTYAAVSYAFTWVSNCSGTPYHPNMTQCAHEEYWVGNLTYDVLSGPFSEAYPETYAPHPPPAGSSLSDLAPWLISVVVVIGAVAAATLVAISVRRRAALNQATLLDSEATGSTGSSPPAGGVPPAPDTTARVYTEDSEPTDTLEDLF
jgi:hypothetical protein